MELAGVADQPVRFPVPVLSPAWVTWWPRPVVTSRRIHGQVGQELLEGRLPVALVEVPHNNAGREVRAYSGVLAPHLFLSILSLKAEKSLSIGCLVSRRPWYRRCLAEGALGLISRAAAATFVEKIQILHFQPSNGSGIKFQRDFLTDDPIMFLKIMVLFLKSFDTLQSTRHMVKFLKFGLKQF